MTIRRPTKDDLPQLEEMIRALAAHHDDVAEVDPAQLARDILGPARWFTTFVAADPSLVGYVSLIPMGQLQFGRRGYDMHHLFVHVSARGDGWGRALVDAACAHARAVGCSFVTVGTAPDNDAAGAFYEHLGFARRVASGPRFGMRI